MGNAAVPARPDRQEEIMAAAKDPKAGPKWRKAPTELVETFQKALSGIAGAEPRKMFGYPCAFVNGQMFTGLHQENMILRLSEEDRSAFLALSGAKIFEPMPGRQMKEYVQVTPEVLASAKDLAAWMGKAFRYASSLPPKEKKAKKR
jgi:TfoX/Sxy family transcriptional regulator of competence genes